MLQTRNNSRNVLVWMDLEMTGLDPQTDTVLEIATLITTPDLVTIAEAPHFIIQTPPERFATMDEWNQKQHTKTGLWACAIASTLTITAAETALLDFLATHMNEGQGILAGSSICQDRFFIARHMPRLHKFLHYRMLDVSSLKILAHHWYAGLRHFQKQENHRASDDIRESIDELRYYRKHLFQPPDLVVAPS